MGAGCDLSPLCHNDKWLCHNDKWLCHDTQVAVSRPVATPLSLSRLTHPSALADACGGHVLRVFGRFVDGGVRQGSGQGGPVGDPGRSLAAGLRSGGRGCGRGCGGHVDEYLNYL